MTDEKHYRSFAEFYPFYLSEHANRTSRRLHFAGTSIALALLITAVVTQKFWLAGAALIQGYLGGALFVRAQQARDLQIPRLQFDGRLAPVVGYFDRQTKILKLTPGDLIREHL